MKKLSLLILILLLSACKNDNSGISYKDASLTVEDRVKDLLQRMTLDEKLMQVQCYWQRKNSLTDSLGVFQKDSATIYLKGGIGQIGRPSESFEGVGGNGRLPKNNAIFTNAIQKYLLEETRLGIPAIFHEECLHGHAAKNGTSFPQPIGLASTWNPELVESLFSMTALEARSRGTHQALTPVLDVCREPRWGRVEETYGEDPYLVGEIGLAAVYGFQGRNDGQIDSNHIIATLKHLTGHGQPEGGNNISPANLSKKTILEVFLPPFKKAITIGKAKSVMASYNEIDGIPSHANSWLLDDILRKEWNFEGTVVSDYFAVRELHDRHRVVPDWKAAAITSLRTGVDIELPDPEAYPLLKEAIMNSEIPENLLDKAVSRTLRHKFELGLFENPYVDPERAEDIVGNKAHAELALKAAEESIILLQNKGGIAPIDPSNYKNIAVIGPNADKELLGGYSDKPKYVVTFLEGLKEKLGDKVNITYAEGCGITEAGSWYKDPVIKTKPEEDLKKIEEAVKIARKADLVILVLGGNELTSREAWVESHLGDRTDLQLPGLQDKLIDAIAELNKKTIAFLFNGRPLATTNLKEKVPVIFECWYLGQEAGRATANVLTGDINPSGKLPISIPRSVGHIPAFYNYKPTARRGYLWDDVTALWPFGYGLSYSKFSIGEPVFSKDTIKKGGSVKVTVAVKNTGDREGKEVIQLYIRDLISSVTRPVKELKAFKKISLSPGEEQIIEFELNPDSFSFFNNNDRWVLEPGEFEIMVGNSSLDSDLKKRILNIDE